MIVRYTLRKLELLHQFMKHPGRGTSYSISTLAKGSGVSRSQIGRLHSGDLKDLDVNEAHAVAEALGVAVLVLFVPPASPTQ